MIPNHEHIFFGWLNYQSASPALNFLQHLGTRSLRWSNGPGSQNVPNRTQIPSEDHRDVPSGSLWQCLVGNYYLQLYIFRSYVKAPEGTNSMRALGDNQNQPFPNPHAAATPCNQPLWSQLICAWKSGGLKDVALAEFVPQKS